MTSRHLSGGICSLRRRKLLFWPWCHWINGYATGPPTFPNLCVRYFQLLSWHVTFSEYFLRLNVFSAAGSKVRVEGAALSDGQDRNTPSKNIKVFAEKTKNIGRLDDTAELCAMMCFHDSTGDLSSISIGRQLWRVIPGSCRNCIDGESFISR